MDRSVENALSAGKRDRCALAVLDEALKMEIQRIWGKLRRLLI